MSGAGRTPACVQTRFGRAARSVRRRGVICPLLSLSEQVVNHVACAGCQSCGLCFADAPLWHVPYVHGCGDVRGALGYSIWPVLSGCRAVACPIRPCVRGWSRSRIYSCVQTRFGPAARCVRRSGVERPLLSLSEQVVNHVACAVVSHVACALRMPRCGMFHYVHGCGDVRGALGYSIWPVLSGCRAVACPIRPCVRGWSHNRIVVRADPLRSRCALCETKRG